MWVLAVGAALAWALVWWQVRPPVPSTAAASPQAAAGAPRETLGQALRGFGTLLLLPHTWGIMLMGAANYASFMALRGLWLGPMLIERHGLSLVASGHVALAISVVSLLSPPLFGRFDPPSPHRRRRLIIGCALACCAGCWPTSRWRWPSRCSRASWCCSTPTCALPTRPW
jgi:hypothetical protein